MAQDQHLDLEEKLERARSLPESTAARLLAAAERAFAEHGFEGARTRDIAAAADANIASLHFHWRDKRTLYAAVLRTFQQRFAAFQDDFSKGTAQESSTPTERLQSWFALGFATTRGAPWMSRIEVRRIANARPVTEFDDLSLWIARFRLGEEMLKANVSANARKTLDLGLTSMALIYLMRMFLCDSDVQQKLLGGSVYRSPRVQERVLRFLDFVVRRLLVVEGKKR